MHSNEIAGMLKALRPVIKNQQKAKEILERYWKDKIALIWKREDVHRAANERRTVLTQKEAREILQDLFTHHNKQYGLQWKDVIEIVLSTGLGRKITRTELSRFINQDVIAIQRTK